MHRPLFVDLIERSIEDERDDRALLSIYALLLQNKLDLGRSFAEGLLTGVPASKGLEVLPLLNRLASRLALVTVLSSIHETNADKRVRRVGRQINFADAIFVRERAIGHREFTVTWFDQLWAYLIAIEAIRDLVKRDSIPLSLLGVLAERVVVAASYQLSHVEELLDETLPKRNEALRRRFIERVRSAIRSGTDHHWYPEKLRGDDIRRGMDRVLDRIVSSPPERLTTVLQQIDLRGLYAMDEDTPIQFLAPLAENAAFTSAARRVSSMLNMFE